MPVCSRPRFVTVGDPTTTQITAAGPVSPTVDHGITENEAWCAVALATLGALLVWADTGEAGAMLVPVFLLLFFSRNDEKT